MLALEPLAPSSFSEFVDRAIAGYASDNVAAGRLKPKGGLEVARKEMEQLLPGGIDTPGHSVFGLTVSGQSAPVGYLWVASMQRGSAKVAYIYQIMVKPECRRRGYAGEALQQVEALARKDGHSAMALNVFAKNTQAQSLYSSLGYFVTNVYMVKPLGSKWCPSLRSSGAPTVGRAT